MAAAAAAPPPISAPTTAYEAKLSLVHGGDDLSDGNLNGSALGLPLSLTADHWLRKASGGATTVTWHEMETAIAAAIYFDGDDLSLIHI